MQLVRITAICVMVRDDLAKLVPSLASIKSCARRQVDVSTKKGFTPLGQKFLSRVTFIVTVQGTRRTASIARTHRRMRRSWIRQVTEHLVVLP